MIEVLPVLDLLGGQVVRGVAGRRETYRPIRSVLTDSAAPADVAAALHDRGFRACYVADLDAIMGGPLSAAELQAVLRTGLRIWLDAGLGADPPRHWPDELAESLAAAVVGAETAPDQAALQRQAEYWGSRAVFSLDLHRGVPLGAWSQTPPIELAELAVEAGFRRLIVLDLAHVGTHAGAATAALCRELHRRHPALELTSGGGIRDARDLAALDQAGCQYALVASALHDGRL